MTVVPLRPLPAADWVELLRAQVAATSLTAVADRVAAGALAELPDVFLILINRAIDRDLPGIAELSRHPLSFSRSPTP